MNRHITRNNHYVPQWYQRAFLAPGQSTFHVLDFTPGERVVRGEQVVHLPPIRVLAPARAFCTTDLYTTVFGGQANDEIERYLFGDIDRRGAQAVRAFVAGQPAEMHDNFQSFFEYLDAQKLRTPKGLDWIRSQYPTLSQLELMIEMQGLRLMHATMWTEGVREIVSAEGSDVKFIVSDHPVTLYNEAFVPTSAACAYPNDPPLELAGTITLFVLNPNTCLILSHSEFAQDPATTDPARPRTNARYRGRSLVRTDAFIRNRTLSRDEVVAVNHVLRRGRSASWQRPTPTGCTPRPYSRASGRRCVTCCFQRANSGASAGKSSSATRTARSTGRTRSAARRAPTSTCAVTRRSKC